MTREGETPHSRWMSCIMKLKEGLAFPKVFFHNNKKKWFPKKIYKTRLVFLGRAITFEFPMLFAFRI